eukprot:3493448-Rhodomonas_salina.1
MSGTRTIARNARCPEREREMTCGGHVARAKMQRFVNSTVMDLIISGSCTPKSDTRRHFPGPTCTGMDCICYAMDNGYRRCYAPFLDWVFLYTSVARQPVLTRAMLLPALWYSTSVLWL